MDEAKKHIPIPPGLEDKVKEWVKSQLKSLGNAICKPLAEIGITSNLCSVVHDAFYDLFTGAISGVDDLVTIVDKVSDMLEDQLDKGYAP